VFETVFDKFHVKNDGIKAIGIWGKDGLELEKVFYSDMEDIDLEFSGAELADIISKLDNTKISPEQFFLKMNFYGLHLRVYSLTPEYFLIIISDLDVMDGKIKFYLNLYKDDLISLF
jgi:predicted regulator of Ras-like GTPase activity (Roadblock/LC7/MglB family)